MAEVQKNTLAGENVAHFIQFLMMQQQQTLLALGAHPNPPAGAPPANYALAKALLDQLGAIEERTRGNLSADEQNLFSTVMTNLRNAYGQKVRGVS